MFSVGSNIFYAIRPGNKLLGLHIKGYLHNIEDAAARFQQLFSTSIIVRDKVMVPENIPDKLVEHGIKEEHTSKAMRAYVERSQAHNKFIAQENEDYKTGKRHLANMMGKDPETFTQDDVNEAIEYLFPSGLFVKKSRPFLKPPEEVHPPKKDAQFDETGRPHHYQFYTGKSNLYDFLHKLVNVLNELNTFEDTMIRKQLKPDPALALTLEGYNWLSKEDFENKFLEPLTIYEHRQLMSVIERIAEHPYAYRVKDVIHECQVKLVNRMSSLDIPKPELQADGRQFITFKDSRRKTARADVTVRSPGTGLVTINGYGLTYFVDLYHREQLLFPLHLTGKVGAVDIEATVQGGGASAQAGAIRFGIARALRSFVEPDMMERMRLAGLLTRDIRKRERKKPGQEKARKKFTWKKR